MSKLHDVVEETLIAYGGRSVISVIMFGRDEKIEQMISDHPLAYFLSLHDAYYASMASYSDIMICTENVTKEEVDEISNLMREQFSNTVIIEESEGDTLSKKDTASIHQNKYEHFTYLDDNTPNIIVYSKTADITSSIGSSLSVFRSYTGDYVSGVSIQSAPLSNVPFTIIGRSAALIEPEDLDGYLSYSSVFGLDCKGGEN
jgi:hypothetical protein